jgi:8-oxo-dGTP diphosphatase
VSSGDGYVELADGSKRWGLFGAAGVLVRAEDEHREMRYLVAKRSAMVHVGGTWGVPGGALHEGEDPLVGALRELAEETGYVIEEFDVLDHFDDDYGGWSYQTFLLGVAEPFREAPVLNWETDELAWVTAPELDEMDLFGAFRITLEKLGIL